MMHLSSLLPAYTARNASRLIRLLCLLLFGGVLAIVWHVYAPGSWGHPVYMACLYVMAGMLVMTLIHPFVGLLLLALGAPLLPAIPLYLQGGEPYPIVLFAGCAFVIGWCARGVWRPHPLRAFPGMTCFGLFLVIVAIAGLASLLRYFPPWQWQMEEWRSLIVNHKEMRAEDALRYVVFVILQYGVFGAIILCGVTEIRRLYARGFAAGSWLIWTLMIAGVVASAVTYYQYHHDVTFVANTSYFWIRLRRVNGTCSDPNAFGGFISLCIVLAVARIFFSGSYTKIRALLSRLIALLMCIIYVFAVAYSGSRSGLLAILMSLSVALFIIGVYYAHVLCEYFRIPIKIRVLAAVIVCSAAAACIWYLPTLISRADERLHVTRESTSLARRIKRDFRLFQRDRSVVGMLHDERRLLYWRYARNCMQRYPLTGIGLGSYVIELPNLTAAAHERLYRTDNACNYYLHHGAETGYPGLIMLGGFYFFLFVGIAIAAYRHRHDISRLHMMTAFALALGAYLCVLIFGVHTLADESNTAFALVLAACAAIVAEEGGMVRVRRAGKIGVALAIFFLLCVYIWSVYNVNTRGSLQNERRRAIYALPTATGWYATEHWHGVHFPLRWMQETAVETIPHRNAVLKIPMISTLPSCDETPHRADIYLNGIHARRVEFTTPGEWKMIRVPVTYADPFITGFSPRTTVRIEVDRTWVPAEVTGEADTRRLGLAIGAFDWDMPEAESHGFYVQETREDGTPFRWTSGYAWKKCVLGPSRQIEIPLHAAHIFLRQHHVQVALYFNARPLGIVTFRDKKWKTYRYTLDDVYDVGSTGLVEIITSRVWVPRHYGFDDTRTLGVAVGEIKSQ